MAAVAHVAYATFARFLVGGVLYGVATQDALRLGTPCAGLLEDDAELSRRLTQGLAAGQSVTLTLVDRADADGGLVDENDAPLLDEYDDPLATENAPFGAAVHGLDGAAVYVDTVCTVTFDNGSVSEQVASQQLTVMGSSVSAGRATVTLVDIEDQKLNTLFPTRTYRVEDFPQLRTDDAGNPVPNPNGLARKLPCTLISSAALDYRYAYREGTGGTVLAVYRNGRLVDPAEYTVATAGSPFSYSYIKFTSEQVDYDGTPYAIACDFDNTGSVAREASEEVKRLLQAAGVATDTASFTIALGVCTAAGLFVDTDHGRSGQRTVRAIVEELLVIARAALYRTATGTYAIAQDKDGAVAAAYDENGGDLVEVMGVDRPAKPTSVAIRYRPSPVDPDKLQHLSTRTIPGGALGALPVRDEHYLVDHSAADRHLYYMAARADASRRLRARLYGATHTPGQIVRVSSRAHYLTASLWILWEVRQIPGGIEVEGREYTPATYGYIAGALPADAATVYSPDYTKTPPLAPSALRITAGSTAAAADGPITARVTVDCLPPAVNWNAVWFAALHNVTNEIPSLLLGADIGGGLRGVTLTGLRPGEVYKLQAYAINANGVQGVVQSTFDATAIGGGGAVTTFTAPGHATVPGNVASCTATQRMGRMIDVTWPVVAAGNLWGYVLERQIGAGAFAEVWRGRANSYRDPDVSIGTAYTYRVKARDTYGNLSASYATSSSVTPTGNITGGTSGNDIGSSTVVTGNRTSVSTFSTSYTNPGAGKTGSYGFTHSVGKIPLLTIDLGGKTTSMACLRAVDTSAATVIVLGMWLGTPPISDHFGNTGNNLAAGDPHAHNMDHNHSFISSAEGGTINLRVW